MVKKAAVLIISFYAMAALTGCNAGLENKSVRTEKNVPTAEQPGEQGKEPVKLTLLNGMVEVVDFFDAYFQNYNSTNKDNIVIQTDYQKEATKVLQVKLASGNAPDIIVGITPTQNMIDQGSFVDLSNEPFWNKLSPSDKEFNTDVKSGKIYSVGLCQSIVGLFYNKAIFGELGLKPADTWNDFINNLQTIKKNKPGIIPFYIGGKDSWILQHMSNFIHGGIVKQKMSYTEQQRAMLGIDLKKLRWDSSPEGTLVTYAKDLLELRDKGLINTDVVKATYGNQIEEFASGRTAIISQGLWAADLISEKKQDTENIGFSQYPAIVKDEKPVVGTGTDVVAYIYSGTKYKDECLKVLESMLKPDSMKAISEGRKAPSANPDVKTNWGYLKGEVTKVLNNPSNAIVTWTTMPAWFTGDDEGRMWQDLLVGKYKDPVVFAKDYINAWCNGISK
ncbi:MAG: extracellular solute-binding protein [Bacillota bacterium]|nr:extracellular solute-binding protein [Bacillota bacterium]